MPTGPRSRRRRLAAVLGVTAVSALGAGPALTGVAHAAPAPDPQTTNIPNLGWLGEQLRLVKCSPDIQTAGTINSETISGGLRFTIRNEDKVQTADLLVESWTGSGRDPGLESGTVDFFTGTGDHRGEGCVKADYASLEPGLARIKLVVTDQSEGRDQQNAIVLKHQFLAGWMTMDPASIHEVSATDPTGTPWLGDPAGDGLFNAGANNGRVQVGVTGQLPVKGGQTLTLPRDWATMADLYATDDDPDTTHAQEMARWDIHDDLTKAEGHVSGYCADQVVPGTKIDAVDNCNGQTSQYAAVGEFSRVFGDSIPAVGPFDPERASHTLLSDGKLDAGDAPMPAAEVDVAIAPNTPGGIDGVGSLEPANKLAVYSRNGTGQPDAAHPNNQHNLYAPFYQQWIPATDAPPSESSGVDGPAKGNDFQGFLVDGLYDNWDIAHVFGAAVPASTTCLRRSDVAPSNRYRKTPAGAQSVAVYTDEHGEAQVEYNPGGSGGNGFFFDSLPNVSRNANGSCDLQKVTTLGTSDIRALAKYPYQPVDANDPAASAPLHKVVRNLFSKTLSVFPKNNDPTDTNDANVRIVIAHAQDIDGRGFDDEEVCFSRSSEGESLEAFSAANTGGIFTKPNGEKVSLQHTYVVQDHSGVDRLCVRTNEFGNAAIEVLNSKQQMVDLMAEFKAEGIFRTVDIDFAGNVPVDNVPPSTGTGGTGNPGTTVTVKHPPLAGNGVSAPKTGKGSTSTKRRKVRTTVTYARIIRTRSGRRYVKVYVLGTAKHAKLRVSLYNRRHHRMKRVTTTVKTNRYVRLSHAKVARTVRSASVRIVH